MRIVIINKSDSTGGAAVVSRRLMLALREEGVDARMLVVEKLTDSRYVEVAASAGRIRRKFLEERIKIFFANGFVRRTLFKIDTASDGLPLWRHPLVADADAVLLNWVNQGMLSLKGVERILELGKPVIWTMHDMWNMTGVCHHAGTCTGFRSGCERCPLLGDRALLSSIAPGTWNRKDRLYRSYPGLKFVGVSNWLKDKAEEGRLIGSDRICVIPNAFPVDGISESGHRDPADGTIRIGFGAARLDDPIKGLPVIVEMTDIIRRKYPELADRMELVTFGRVKNPDSFRGISLPHRHLGMVKGEDGIRDVYENTDIIVSASSYETLPGTLVEAQAYGCIPVSFNQGGQRDIVTHLSTGYIAEYSDNIDEAAGNLADGVAWAAGRLADKEDMDIIRRRMIGNVREKFSPSVVARAYIGLIRGMGPGREV